MQPTLQPLIYVVDDDPDEHHLLQTVFSSHYGDCAVRCFHDGDELLIQLTHCLDGRMPDLILLDWHMPILGGHQVLQLLQTDSAWRSIPVVVRSTSQSDATIKTFYELGAKGFLIKSNTYQQCVDSVISLGYTWNQPVACMN